MAKSKNPGDNKKKRTKTSRRPTVLAGAKEFSVAAQLPPVSSEQIEAARRKFEEGVVARGEAVEAGKPLPPGATHEIIGHRPDGTPILKRSRFSMR